MTPLHLDSMKFSHSIHSLCSTCGVHSSCRCSTTAPMKHHITGWLDSVMLAHVTQLDFVFIPALAAFKIIYFLL